MNAQVEIHDSCLPNDTVSLLEAIDARPDFKNFSSNITAKDSGPLLDKDAMVLHVPVNWVDRDGSILYNDLPGSGCR
jgi:hypothetical protein